MEYITANKNSLYIHIKGHVMILAISLPYEICDWLISRNELASFTHWLSTER